MAPRAIRDDDADYSFLIKQCSSAINCCSVNVRFCATRWPLSGQLSGGRCEGDHGRTKLESCRCLRTAASAAAGNTPVVGAATAAFCAVIAEPMPWRFSAAALNSAGCVLTNDIWHSLHTSPHPSLVRDVN
jgi:hypothetical protein